MSVLWYFDVLFNKWRGLLAHRSRTKKLTEKGVPDFCAWYTQVDVYWKLNLLLPVANSYFWNVTFCNFLGLTDTWPLVWVGASESHNCNRFCDWSYGITWYSWKWVSIQWLNCRILTRLDCIMSKKDDLGRWLISVMWKVNTISGIWIKTNLCPPPTLKGEKIGIPPKEK